jgi:hypothetical protein
MSELLAEVRAHGAVFREAIITPPWAMRIASGVPLTLATMLNGHAWIVPDRHEPVLIAAGDIAIVRGEVPYVVADDPTTTPSLRGREMHDSPGVTQRPEALSSRRNHPRP